MVGPLSGLQHFRRHNRVVERLLLPLASAVNFFFFTDSLFLGSARFATAYFVSFLGKMLFPPFLNTGTSSFSSATYLLVYV